MTTQTVVTAPDQNKREIKKATFAAIEDAKEKVQLMVPVVSDQPFDATVRAVTDQIDPGTRTIKIRATVANPDRLLKSEMLAKVRYARAVGKNIEVPASSVFLRDKDHYVFVQTAPGVFAPRDVKVAYEGAQKVLLSEGLQAGEQEIGRAHV